MLYFLYLFRLAGTSQAAPTRGFGVVFADVDAANTTSIQAFDQNNNSLGTFFAPVANNGLSFVGVSFNTPTISRVRITSGNTAVGPNDGGAAADVVVMDDFIYAEPVPEPGTLALLGVAAAGAGGWRWRRRRAT